MEKIEYGEDTIETFTKVRKNVKDFHFYCDNCEKEFNDGELYFYLTSGHIGLAEYKEMYLCPDCAEREIKFFIGNCKEMYNIEQEDFDEEGSIYTITEKIYNKEEMSNRRKLDDESLESFKRNL